MIVSALATAGYAYLVGPMIRLLFMENVTSPAGSVTIPVLKKISFFLAGASPRWIALAILATAAIKGIAFFAQTLLTAKSGQNVLHRLRRALWLGLVRLNPLDARASAPGDLVARFTVDVNEVETAVTKGIVLYIRSSIEILFITALAIALDYRLGLIGLVAFLPAGILIARIGRALRRRRRAVNEAVGEVATAVNEAAVGLSTIQSYGARSQFSARFDTLSRKIRRRTLRALAVRAASSPMNEVLGAGALAATLLFAADAIAEGSLSPETFVSFFTALFMLYQPVKGIGQAHHSVQCGIAALERILPIVGEAPPAEKETGRHRPSLDTALALCDICTGYPHHPDIIKDVSLTINRGDRIALVGPSGAGKSTLLNLLLGFLEARNGTLLIDGDAVPLERFQRLFAPVRQEPFLFDGTIEENVKMGRPDASDAAVEAAMRGAGVTAFTANLEHGAGTRVGPMGQALSLGQRQRVSLARALLSDAPVLLLDEVTASLDGRTEKSIVSELTAAFANRTVLIVTHRLATARWAERLIYMEEGRIVEAGRSESLLQKSDRVRALFGDQS